MKQTITKSDFRDAFRNMGRNDQFSYEGLGVLFDYFEQLEEDTGEEIELDVIALCCEYYEDTWEEIARNYSIDAMGDNEQCADEVREYLEQNTIIVGEVPGGCVYLAF